MSATYKLFYSVLLFIIVPAYGDLDDGNKSGINVFSSIELFRKSSKKELYRFYDYRTKGYGYKSEKDASKYVIEPIFESVDWDENYIKLYFDLNKTFNSELANRIKARMPKERTGVVRLLANSEGFIELGFEHDINPYYKTYSGLIPVKRNELTGCINRKGELVIPYQYELLSFLDSNIIWVSNNNKCGLIDTTGKVIVPITFDMIDYPITKKNNVFGVMNNKGSLFIDNYEETYQLYDVSKKRYYNCGIKNDKCDLLNDNGQYIMSFENEKVHGVDDSILTLYRFDAVRKHSVYRYYNVKTKKFFGEGYDDTDNSFKTFRFGNAIVSLNYKCGVINTEGQLILPCEYTNVDIGKNNIIGSKNGKSYLFDRYGKQLTEYPYYQLDFRERREREDELFVHTHNGMGLIDLKGNVLIEPKYSSSFYFDGYRWFLFDPSKRVTDIYNAETKKMIDSMPE